MVQLVQSMFPKIDVYKRQEEDKLTAAHAAFMNSGVFLYVPKNVVIEEPIESLFIQDSDSNQPFFKHVLILSLIHI